MSSRCKSIPKRDMPRALAAHDRIQAESDRIRERAGAERILEQYAEATWAKNLHRNLRWQRLGGQRPTKFWCNWDQLEAELRERASNPVNGGIAAGWRRTVEGSPKLAKEYAELSGKAAPKAAKPRTRKPAKPKVPASAEVKAHAAKLSAEQAFRMSGKELKTAAMAGNQGAIDEIERRAAKRRAKGKKPLVTV